jgi:hypothetical protein
MTGFRQIVAVSLLCALAFACGCGAEEPAGLDAAAWVQEVRSAHAAADAALQAGQAQAALERLNAALSLPVPADVQAEHHRVVHQDLLFRVAQAQLQVGHSGEAWATADRGLGLGTAQDLFTANLLIARGQALEAEHRDTEAAASYYEALVINRVLLGAALGRREAEAP